MKAPFGVGDIVQRIETPTGCGESTKLVPIGTITTIRETRYESNHWSAKWGGGVRVSTCNNYGNGWDVAACYKLYEPPKPEQSTNTTVNPVSALVPSLE